jgi:hypothetical protein
MVRLTTERRRYQAGRFGGPCPSPVQRSERAVPERGASNSVLPPTAAIVRLPRNSPQKGGESCTSSWGSGPREEGRWQSI